MRSFFKTINKFGLAGGISVYMSLKLNKQPFSLPSYRHNIYLRNTNSDRYTFKEIFLKEQYEIGNIIENPKFIIDAGANIGISTVYFAKKYPTAKVFAIEPDPENFKLITLNTGPLSNVVTFNGGLWNKNTNLRIIDHDLGPRSLATTEADENNNHSVKAITLSDIFIKENFKAIDILKMDIEGSEKEVFSANYEDWLPFTQILIIEMHDRMNPGCSKSVFSAISKYNFSLRKIVDENLVFTNDDYIQVSKKDSYLT